MNADHSLYNMRHNGGKGMLFLEMCLLFIYLPPNCLGQYLVTYHINVRHISSVSAHDVKRYRNTLLPWPCMQRDFKHENHEVVQHYCMFHQYDWIFHQNLYFAHCHFYLWCVSETDQSILTGYNEYCFTNIQHSQPHTTLYWEVILFSWGGKILHKFESLIITLLSVLLTSLIPPSSGGLTML